MKLTLVKTSLLAGLISGNILHAVEPLQPVKPAPAPQVAEKAPLPKQKSWLGVMSFPVDELLSSHLGLDGGVVLQVVSDNSPAAKAGLKVNDIITEMDGQAVNDHLALREMIHGKDIGAEIIFNVISNGAKKKVTTVLEPRPFQIGVHKRHAPGNNAALELKLEEGLNQALPMIEGFDERVIKVHVERLRKQFEQMNGKQDVLKQLFQEFPELGNPAPNPGNADEAQDRLGGIQLNLKDLLKNVIPEANGEAAFALNSTVRVKDAEGVVEMKMNNGNKEICIKDINGEILYQGPYNNEQDKAAIPADLAPRVKGVGMHGNNGLQFRIEGLNPAKKAPDELKAE